LRHRANARVRVTHSGADRHVSGIAAVFREENADDQSCIRTREGLSVRLAGQAQADCQ
jgi:hypothetical protein